MHFNSEHQSSVTNRARHDIEPATVEQILAAYAQGNLDTLLSVLAQRPHSFAQQLNRICRAFPSEIERIAVTLQEMGEKLPQETLVRLYNQYSHAARGVGEKLSQDNSRMVHLLQTPVLSRAHAARLLLALELCLAPRMRGLIVTVPPQDFYQPMDAEPQPISCNPLLDGAVNPVVPTPWEAFSLGHSHEAVALSATGIREIPDGYDLSVLLLDDDYRCIHTIERGSADTYFSCFWDEEAEESDNDIRCGLGLGYCVEEYAEINVHRAMKIGARYVVVSALVGESFSDQQVEGAPENSSRNIPMTRFTSQVAPDLRSLVITQGENIRPVAHRGNFHVIDSPGRTLCAVLDLYKQRITLPAVGIPAGADEEKTLAALMSALNGYIPMTVREYMSLAGATVTKSR